jgi:hypothetical protein
MNNRYVTLMSLFFVYASFFHPLQRTGKAGQKTRNSLARSARGWLGSARLGSL